MKSKCLPPPKKKGISHWFSRFFAHMILSSHDHVLKATYFRHGLPICSGTFGRGRFGFYGLEFKV